MNAMWTRRKFVLGAAAGATCTPALVTCASGASYEKAAQEIWRHGNFGPEDQAAVLLELVRHATLAPSSHNTQCWKFRIEQSSISILPDLSRRCPAVDPDDHHLFVSLGCAAENLLQAAGAHGLSAQPDFDPATGEIAVALLRNTLFVLGAGRGSEGTQLLFGTTWSY